MSGIPLTTKDFTSRESIPEWLSKEYKTFNSKVSDNNFPCYFGTSAETRGHLRYTLTEGRDLSGLPDTLCQFLKLSASHPKTKHALVLFEQPEPRPETLDSHRDRFWQILQYLHDNDPCPWPDNVEQSPQDPGWEFSFGGDSMFVFGSSPAYQKRKSRNLGSSLILLFQPRRVFRGIEGGTSQGAVVQNKIRDKLREYDAVPHHPDMGAYSDPLSYEWKQYFIPDENVPIIGECPLRMHHKTAEAVGSSKG